MNETQKIAAEIYDDRKNPAYLAKVNTGLPAKVCSKFSGGKCACFGDFVIEIRVAVSAIFLRHRSLKIFACTTTGVGNFIVGIDSVLFKLCYLCTRTVFGWERVV